MAKILELNATPRTVSGTTAVKRLRKTGRIPAVVYGKKHANTNVDLDSKSFTKLLAASASDNILVNLKIEGESTDSLALVQEVQHDHLRGGILHVDFHAVAADEIIHASVAIVLTGLDIAEKKGGMLEHIMHSVEVLCLPKDLPEKLTLEVASLELNQSKHISDLQLPAGVTTKIDGKVVIAVLKEPLVVEEVAPVAAAVTPVAGAPAAAGAAPAAPAKGAAAPAKAAAAPAKK